MNGINKLIIVGNLVENPRLKELNEGKCVCNFTLAVNTGFSKAKRVDYFKVNAWNKLGRTCSGLKKGDTVYVSGPAFVENNESHGKQYCNMCVSALEVTFLRKSAADAADENSSDEYGVPVMEDGLPY